ncbi:hypothetical protein E4K67_17305 [Desulfosporosinus fructosivorans]|uniref:Uncharacterized protein n=1 Tax=Desulfosporosinus fructosivorans TaxID=2018669 RepID=A0A4Z0R4C7_9FIRM|nr:hypothetical protein [Desulfosporosinus fructosivorans]TGE36857.1 hypothetical protein E4K67_17305 [Desulfosporosinus fructosivorans]
MLKQSSTQLCLCGQTMKFPEGEIRTKCSCGATWECGFEGYWYAQSIVTPFAPILAKPAVSSSKSRNDRYRNYPKSKIKNKKKGRKVGSRC